MKGAPAAKTTTPNYPRLLLDRVAVVRDDAEEKTPGGVLLPDTAKEKPKRGLVVAVGLGRPDQPITDLKVGDRVLFTSYAGNAIEHNGEELLIMRYEDIMAVL